MGRVQSSIGLITGIPVQETIDKLLALSARPRVQLEKRVEDLKNEKLAIAELTALVIGIELSVQRLASTNLFRQTRLTATDDKILAATATGTPKIGSYQFTPIRRAQSHQLLSQGIASKTAALGAGDVTIQFGGIVDKGARLDELNGGAGVQRGKIKITDRSGDIATIDLRFATTVDDVLRAINENSDIRVSAVTDGDRIKLVDQTGDSVSNLRVQEVGGTSTAADLGLGGINVAASEATGQDILRLYNGLALQRLNDGNGVNLRKGAADLRANLQDGTVVDVEFFGLKKGPTAASATTNAKNGLNAQIAVTSTGVGASFDGYKLAFQDDSTVTSGNEKVSYDGASKTFTVKIDAGNSRAAEVIAKLNADSTFSTLFTAGNGSGGNGTGVVDVADTLTTSGGASEYYNESTLGDVIETINRTAPGKLLAQINASGDSLELVDLTSGAGTFSVASLFGGSVAEDLGFTSPASGNVVTGERRVAGLKTVLLDSLKGGFGTGDLGVLSITNRAGVATNVDLATSKTLEDAIRLIQASGSGVNARINDARNGILLTDTTGGSNNLVIANGDGTNTADRLQISANVAATSVNSRSLSLQTFNETQTLSSLRNGRGIGTGSFLITDSLGNSGAVNPAVLEAKTVGDIIAGINSLGIGVTARINDTGDGLLLIDTAGGSGQLTVADVGSGTSAQNLKIAGTSVLKDLDGIPTKVIDGSYSLRVSLGASDSLQDLVTKINDLGADVAASLFNSGSGATPFRLSLNSQLSGSAGELLIDASALGFSFTETAAAQDALLLVGSLDSPIPGGLVASKTNDFDDVLEGIKLTVNSTSTTPQSITVDKTADDVVAKVKLLADQYNKLREKVKSVASFDAEQNTIGVLFGTTEILQIDLQLTGALSARIFGAGSIQSFEAIGLSPDASGNLQFDEQKFRAKYAADADAVEQFFTQAANGAAARLLAVTNRLAGRDNSTLVNKSIALQRIIDSNQAQIKRMNTTLERQRELMVKQFAHLEEVISRMQARLTSIARIAPIPFSTGSSSR